MDSQSQYQKQILKQLFNYAALNFKKRIEIKIDKTVDKLMPSIALGINVLGDELEFTIKKLKEAHEDLSEANEKLIESNKELTQANIKLTKLNDYKEVLLQEVHHRVKNNLQTILGLLFMQTNRADSAPVKDELKDAQSRIFSISLVHQCLYSKEDFTVDVARYCKELSNNISKLYGNNKPVEINLDLADGVFLSVEKATPLGLILNEVICNCYKHYVNLPHTGNCSVKIHLKKQNYLYDLTVSNKMNHPTTEQTTVKSNSLGNKLIKKLSMQMKAEVNTTINEDYTVSILFS